MKKHLLIEVLGLVIIATAALILMQGWPGKSAEQQRENTRSLRLRAQRTGRITVHGQPRNLKRYDELKPLVKASGAVIVGTVQSKVSRLLEPAETVIVTDYQVDVVEVWNGAVAPGQTIDVREPGGRVDFEDGTFAEVLMPEIWNAPEIGESYIFFLKNIAEEKFSLNGGPQGLFKINGDVITPEGQKQDKLMQTYHGKNRAAFFKEVRDALR